MKLNSPIYYSLSYPFRSYIALFIKLLGVTFILKSQFDLKQIFFSLKRDMLMSV